MTFKDENPLAKNWNILPVESKSAFEPTSWMAFIATLVVLSPAIGFWLGLAVRIFLLLSGL